MTSHAMVVVLGLALVLAAERPAEAYLDPGSGSMLLQLLLGGFAAAVVAGRLLWHRVRARLVAPLRRQRAGAPPASEPDSPAPRA